MCTESLVRYAVAPDRYSIPVNWAGNASHKVADIELDASRNCG